MTQSCSAMLAMLKLGCNTLGFSYCTNEIDEREIVIVVCDESDSDSDSDRLSNGFDIDRPPGPRVSHPGNEGPDHTLIRLFKTAERCQFVKREVYKPQVVAPGNVLDRVSNFSS